jgi:apolipoprotein N-acyltransferase
VAWIPWFYALEKATSAKQAIRETLWLTYFIGVGAFPWVAYVLSQYAGLPQWVGVLGLLVFGFIAQPQYYLLGYPFYKIIQQVRNSSHHTDGTRNTRSILIAIISLASLYTFVDLNIPKLFKDTAGHALVASTYLKQAADLSSLSLLTFSILLTNAALYFLIRSLQDLRRDSKPLTSLKTLLLTLLSIGPLCCLALYGYVRYHQIQTIVAQQAQRIPVTMIQGNIGDLEKISAEQGYSKAADGVLQTFFTLTEEALQQKPRPELILWPETSYPSTYGKSSSEQEHLRDLWMQSWIQRELSPHQISLGFGGYDTNGKQDYNALFIVNASQGISNISQPQVYHKNILLPFGEYIPFAEWFPSIYKYFPMIANFARGIGPEVIPIQTASHSFFANPVICYEALFPEYVRQGVLKQSQLILNITNDSWFGPYGEPQLHLDLISFRSIETRVPQLRSTNTGYSVMIEATGDITTKSSLFKKEIVPSTLFITPPLFTLYKQWGDWFIILCGWLTLVILIRGLVSKYSR